MLGILKKFQHDIVVVNNGVEAIEAFQHQDFDIVLMDVQMPEMDGLEATRKIRKNPHPVKSNIPILALTAHAMVSDRQLCLESGMDDYLSKPFKAADLIAKIDVLMSNQTSDRTNRGGNGPQWSKWIGRLVTSI